MDATLIGGKKVAVKFIDGNEAEVFVRQLPIKLFPQYSQLLENEPGMVEMYCDKPAGWHERLTSGSFLDVLNVGEAVNADFFRAWLVRKAERLQRIAPQMVPEPLRQMLAFPNGSQIPPSAAD